MKNFNSVIAEQAKNAKGCQFISMRYVSSPALNKAQKLAVSVLGGFTEIVEITKEVFGQFQFNMSYENAVNNRGEKEQGEKIDFVAAPLKWGQWVEGAVNKLIEHKGELYLRYYELKNGKVESTYYVGGKLATDEQVKLIKEFTEKGEVKSQAEAGLTENQVIARTVKLDNIKEITISGVNYRRSK